MMVVAIKTTAALQMMVTGAEVKDNVGGDVDNSYNEGGPGII